MLTFQLLFETKLYIDLPIQSPMILFDLAMGKNHYFLTQINACFQYILISLVHYGLDVVAIPGRNSSLVFF